MNTILYVNDKNQNYNFQEYDKKELFFDQLEDKFSQIDYVMRAKYGMSYLNFKIGLKDATDYDIKQIINEIQRNFSDYEFYIIDKDNQKVFYTNNDSEVKNNGQTISEIILSVMIVIIIILILF